MQRKGWQAGPGERAPFRGEGHTPSPPGASRKEGNASPPAAEGTGSFPLPGHLSLGIETEGLTWEGVGWPAEAALGCHRLGGMSGLQTPHARTSHPKPLLTLEHTPCGCGTRLPLGPRFTQSCEISPSPPDSRAERGEGGGDSGTCVCS